MRLLTDLIVTGILCSLNPFYEERQIKRYWVNKMRVLRKDFSKKFYFIICRRQRLWVITLNRGGIADLVFFWEHYKQFVRAKFLRSDRLFCFIGVRPFRNPLAIITTWPELHLGCKRFILVVQIKEVIFIILAA